MLATRRSKKQEGRGHDNVIFRDMKPPLYGVVSSGQEKMTTTDKAATCRNTRHLSSSGNNRNVELERESSSKTRKWWKVLSSRNKLKSVKQPGNKLDDDQNDDQSCDNASSAQKNSSNSSSLKKELTDLTSGGLTEEDVDKDDHSELSDQSSLLQLRSFSYSEDESDAAILLNSELKGIQRLERKLERRRQQLQKLCAGRQSAYVKMLERNDAAAGEISLALYKERKSITKESSATGNDSGNSNIDDKKPQATRNIQQPDAKTGSSSSSPVSNRQKAKREPSIVVLSWWMILFEYNLTLPSFFTVLVVLMGHNTFYCALEVVLKCIYYNAFDNVMSLDLFFLGQILIGLCLIRINGNVFYWMNSKDYKLVRLEMENRLKLGNLDAWFLNRIKGSVFSSALNMFGYYLACVGLFHFYLIGQRQFTLPFEEWYLDVYLEAGGAFNSTTGKEIRPPCHKIDEVVSTSGDVAVWLAHYFCMDTSQEWRVVSGVYHGLSLLVTTVVAAILGHNLMTFCD